MILGPWGQRGGELLQGLPSSFPFFSLNDLALIAQKYCYFLPCLNHLRQNEAQSWIAEGREPESSSHGKPPQKKVKKSIAPSLPAQKVASWNQVNWVFPPSSVGLNAP